MKQILYDTVSQTMVNRAVHSKERREKAYVWITFGNQQHNEVYCSPIHLNLILLTKILNNNGTLRVHLFVWGGGTKVSMRERGYQHFWMGGQALMEGKYPLMGGGSHTPLHIGQPCSYSFLDSRSSLIVRQLKLSQLPLIIGKEGGREGDHNWKIISFTFYMFQSI